MSSNLSALELLELGDEGRKLPFLNKIWPYAMGVFCGVGTACFINMGTMRPVLSGIQKHVLYSGIYSTVFHFLEAKRIDYFAERDAVLRHYVSLHPEDFPTKPRVKYGDMLEKWIPIR